jgi:hypothetical protein
MTDVEQTVRRLEERLRRVEDELAILRLISSYGPAVDSGSSEAAAAIWTHDGVYDSDAATWSGRPAIAGMVDGSAHQALIHEGCAHVLAPPHVELDGDAAVATGYSRVYRPAEDGYAVWRLAANRWELARTPEGWRAVRRVNRLIDGSAEPRQLLADGIAS